MYVFTNMHNGGMYWSWELINAHNANFFHLRGSNIHIGGLFWSWELTNVYNGGVSLEAYKFE